MSAGPVMIMAGGTGGHVFPALAVAAGLRDRGVDVVWLGTRRGLEARISLPEGVAMEWLTISGLRGRGVLVWLLAPWTLGRAVFQALLLIRRVRPAAALGLGGFVSAPGGLAAWLLRVPLLIHEQNSVAGYANRLLARFAQQVLVAYPEAPSLGRACVETGNPVRRELLGLEPPRARFEARSGPLRILVLGGSQGARILNRKVPAGLARLTAEITVLHQAGRSNGEEVRSAYGDLGIDSEVREFIVDMGEAYAWADVVVCRSGALTLSELAAVGLGAVLVPFALAADDHQTCNARYLVGRGAAALIAEKALSASALAETLEGFAATRAAALKRALQAHQLSRPRATNDVVDACLKARAAA
ncbi:MAG: undecaprenyldiphospho-muramoylpentapeptide beta-N-acetylglucosaminyltransferase [Gammaproteobacteria bacterium]|nr:undecaprenyldiphospho-muramoylpentapeptide beta-N-acetylglucosaminyltransferase [Gammaproteobacteria bacterium]MCY4165079.1 undecaprenyldiphospho-muramoylpentapeptide beta-N-acetylglucosaminyltransferase [Gammaproteobacteria bacterium]MCY4255572.1 undecaprenyldiphospho-muramoylpentapeptide beta-N-acetylglucosaminyltransferase [Gammaproteobacteria bacterium]MCY4341492.1 undecaprenyldiphospho-muramoylpentapeptide beta-N-acetylglucosaminyltransferase [Gammaproteobacteria bacterium]